MALSEIRLFLENHSLDFHKIWQGNILGDTWRIEKIEFLRKEILDITVNLQQGC